MAPLTKEGAEAASPAQESSVQQSGTKAKTASGSLHSDAVSLEVPIKIHGSRATGVSRDVTSQTEPFEEETTTIIVFPQGGVLRMATGVNVGQMLVLTNSKSRQDAICRVVKVRNFANMQSYVEVEFTQPQAKYWGVYFPSEGGAARREATTPAPLSNARQTPASENAGSFTTAQKTSGPKPVKAGAYSKDVNPARLPSAPPPSKPASPFVSIGVQEKVQPAAVAASTSEANLSKPVVSEEQTYARELAKSDVTLALATAPTADAASLSLKDSTKASEASASSLANGLQPKHATLGPEAIANTDDILGSLGGEAFASDIAATSPEAFEPRLEADLTRIDSTSGPRQNWMLIAACIAVLFGAVASGFWYFRSKSGASDAQAGSSSVPSVSGSTASGSVEGPDSTETLPASLASGSTATPGQTAFNPASRAEASAMSGSAASAAKNDDAVSTQPNSAVVDAKPAHVPRNMFASKMKAHPLSSARSLDSPNQAPVLDAPAVPPDEAGALPGMNSSNVSVPPPPGFTPEGLVAGDVKEPKLISSVLPVYPSVARLAHVQGDVLVDTEIDKNGNVAHMNVISGPSMLRQAALDALRRWKYKPQELDGKPVEGELLVKIKFRL